MEYRPLGKSGLQVSALSLGTWQTFNKHLTKTQVEHLIHRAIDLGINYFDTADCYQEGLAEQQLGVALKSIERSTFAISTKCFMPCSKAILNRGLSRKHLLDSVERSLKNLQLEYIDVMLCHRYDDTTPIEETIFALKDLQQQGKIAYWGISRFNELQLLTTYYEAKLHQVALPICNQIPYHLLNHQEQHALIQQCQQLGVGIAAYSPLAQGVLTGKYLNHIPNESRAANPETRTRMWHFTVTPQKIRQLLAVAERLKVSLTQLALAFCLANPQIATVIMGVRDLEQLEHNYAAATLTLTKDIFEELIAIAGASE